MIQDPPAIHYTVTVDARDLSAYDVALDVRGLPDTLRLSMAVHPLEDNRFWRYLRDLRVESARTGGAVARLDSNRWQIVVPGGAGTIRWRFAMPPAPEGMRGSWRPFLSPTGALIGGMDGLLYLPEHARLPATVTLALPTGWRVATALDATSDPRGFTARDANALLDAPILAGALREWTVRERGIPFRVVYWPLPNAPAFDTTAFLDGMRRLTRTTVAFFGSAPFARYTFLFQDGAAGALEHASSLTFGLPARNLATDPHAALGDVAHEFFHAWNLLHVRPAGWGELRDGPTTPTPSMWWSEGITLHFADALLRRASLGDSTDDRAHHVADVMEQYLANAANVRYAPADAGRASSVPLGTSDAAMASVHAQGELLGIALDALVRDSTGERRGLDDVMRDLARTTDPVRGFTPVLLERSVARTCNCTPRAFFSRYVEGNTMPDVAHALARVGLRLEIDSMPDVDANGHPRPDTRIAVLAPAYEGARPTMLQVNPASAWNVTALRSGTPLVAVNGTPVASFGDFRRIVRPLQVGDTVTLDVASSSARDERSRIMIVLASWMRPRVRVREIPNVSAAVRARRARWLAGY